jgi:hypothetical protein
VRPTSDQAEQSVAAPANAEPRCQAFASTVAHGQRDLINKALRSRCASGRSGRQRHPRKVRRTFCVGRWPRDTGTDAPSPGSPWGGRGPGDLGRCAGNGCAPGRRRPRIPDRRRHLQLQQRRRRVCHHPRPTGSQRPPVGSVSPSSICPTYGGALPARHHIRA